jgi:polysaccharide deacetylase 2 family uncharacterized protein YibQ
MSKAAPAPDAAAVPKKNPLAPVIAMASQGLHQMSDVGALLLRHLSWQRWLVGCVLGLFLMIIFVVVNLSPADHGSSHADSHKDGHTNKTKAESTADGHAKEDDNNKIQLAAGGARGGRSNQFIEKIIALSSAPAPGLVEETPTGPLPQVSEDGQKPWQAYARPFDSADQRPKISLVMMDLGLSRIATTAAIEKLPGEVTLAFDTQGTGTHEWLEKARTDGHETLLALPMEPFDYPDSDPGPDTMLSTLPNTENLMRLLQAMKKGTGYVGVTTFSGSLLTTTPTKLAPLLGEIRDRGLLFLDARMAPLSVAHDLAKDMKLPSAAATRRVDTDLSPLAIDESLRQLELTARTEGMAIGIAASTPIVLERIGLWLQDLPSRGFVLAPISAQVN